MIRKWCMGVDCRLKAGRKLSSDESAKLPFQTSNNGMSSLCAENLWGIFLCEWLHVSMVFKHGVNMIISRWRDEMNVPHVWTMLKNTIRVI